VASVPQLKNYQRVDTTGMIAVTCSVFVVVVDLTIGYDDHWTGAGPRLQPDDREPGVAQGNQTPIVASPAVRPLMCQRGDHPIKVRNFVNRQSVWGVNDPCNSAYGKE
jgi:hypothetical protein